MRRLTGLMLLLAMLLGGCALRPAEPGPSYSRGEVTGSLTWAAESPDAGEALTQLGYAVESRTEDRTVYRTDPFYSGSTKPEIRTVTVRRVEAEKLPERIAAGSVDLAVTADADALAAARDAGWQLLPREEDTVLLAPFVLEFDPEKPIPEAIAGAKIDWN